MSRFVDNCLLYPTRLIGLIIILFRARTVKVCDVFDTLNRNAFRFDYMCIYINYMADLTQLYI